MSARPGKGTRTARVTISEEERQPDEEQQGPGTERVTSHAARRGGGIVASKYAGEESRRATGVEGVIVVEACTSRRRGYRVARRCGTGAGARSSPATSRFHVYVRERARASHTRRARRRRVVGSSPRSGGAQGGGGAWNSEGASLLVCGRSIVVEVCGI